MKKLSPEGHRARVRQRYLNEGLQNFQPHEVLEFLMFFTIPRRDTKPYARALINHYSDLTSILNAPKEELIKFDSITERTADFFKFLPEAWECLSIFNEESSLFSYNLVVKHVISRFENCTTPDFIIMLLDISGYCVFSTKLFEGNILLLEDYISDIVELVSMHHASYVICAHNRPGNAKVYNDDIVMINKLCSTLEITGAQLRDHLIVNGKQTVSFLLKNYLMLPKHKN